MKRSLVIIFCLIIITPTHNLLAADFGKLSKDSWKFFDENLTTNGFKLVDVNHKSKFLKGLELVGKKYVNKGGCSVVTGLNDNAIVYVFIIAKEDFPINITKVMVLNAYLALLYSRGVNVDGDVGKASFPIFDKIIKCWENNDSRVYSIGVHKIGYHPMITLDDKTGKKIRSVLLFIPPRA